MAAIAAAGILRRDGKLGNVELIFSPFGVGLFEAHIQSFERRLNSEEEEATSIHQLRL